MGTDTLEQFTLFDMEEEVLIEEGEDVQECKRCKKNKPLKHFKIKNIYANNKGILSRVCSKCEVITSREQQKRIKNYPPPPEDYKCPQCQKNAEEILNQNVVVYRDTFVRVKERSRKFPWRLDHDHITGEIRGWLCNSCNVSSGQLGDNLESAERLVKYYKGELDGSTGIYR
jgi:hypothetical protein|tara:strand:- start:32 stop:547 length:516 start_codon:yes stop_codon:yes gene_type:complete